MCGIAGIVSFNGEGQVADLRAMTQAIRHRGPDDEGYYTWNGVGGHFYGEDSVVAVKGDDRYKALSQDQFTLGFGHRRLSIIDLEAAAHQPMTDGRYVIVYNGEIYNYKELRVSLERRGVVFQSTSDTEVVLQSFILDGSECVNSFEGMWSFVIFDQETRKLFGSRDITGVKPFYYYQSSKEFLFASETKAIQSVRPLTLNENAALDFLVFGRHEISGESLYNEIIELPPAHSFWLDVDNGILEQWQYYGLPEAPVLSSFDECVEMGREILMEAVSRHLRADVEVGVCLSGGIDSSILCGMIAREFGASDKLKAFTSIFPGESIDESMWAKSVVDYNDCTWHTIQPDSVGLKADLQRLIRHQEGPLLSLSTYAQYKVFERVAQEGVKVVLNGQGADELFAGYPHLATFGERNVLGNMRTLLFGAASITRSYHIKEQVKRRWWANPSKWESQLRKHNPELNLIRDSRLTEYLSEAFAPDHPNLKERLKHEFFGAPLKNLLRYEDRNSMAHSVESRLPFADTKRLWEFAFSIPDEIKLKDGHFKLLLREIGKPFLPNEVYQRRDKKGFVSPNNAWLRALKPVLSQSFNEEIPLLKPLTSKDLDSLFPQNDAENYRSLRYLTFALWVQSVDL